MSTVAGFFYNILFIMVCAIIPFVFMTLVFLIYRFIKGDRFKKRTEKSLFKKRNFFVRLLVDFPKMIVRDLMARNPDCMRDTGLIIFEGVQGCGKTSSAVQMIREILKKYPLVKFQSNIRVDFQHSKIVDIDDVAYIHNGEIGMISLFDEFQNIFSCSDSVTFPPEMLGTITALRKQRILIVGTTQRFSRLAKPIREQTKYVFAPITFFGCLTIVRVFQPVIDEKAELKSRRFIRAYFFVHDKELRECYDTYEMVKDTFKNKRNNAPNRRAVWDED